MTIDVERSDLPTRLRSEPDRILFSTLGEREQVMIRATFSDGAYLVATQSSNMAFSTSNAAVATIDANGVVKSVGPGNAIITASYTQGTQSVSVSIAVTVPPPNVSPSFNKN